MIREVYLSDFMQILEISDFNRTKMVKFHRFVKKKEEEKKQSVNLRTPLLTGKSNEHANIVKINTKQTDGKTDG